MAHFLLSVSEQYHGRKENRCSECGLLFSSGMRLRYHIKSKHSAVRPFKCNICDKVKGPPSSVLSLIQQVHFLRKKIILLHPPSWLIFNILLYAMASAWPYSQCLQGKFILTWAHVAKGFKHDTLLNSAQEPLPFHINKRSECKDTLFSCIDNPVIFLFSEFYREI